MKLNLQNTIIDKVQTMKDRSYKITLISKELPLEERVALFNCVHDEVPEIEIEVDLSVEKKTPSQRLRDRLYVYHRDVYKGGKEFRIWYEIVLEEIGNKYLDKLPKDGA